MSFKRVELDSKSSASSSSNVVLHTLDLNKTKNFLQRKRSSLSSMFHPPLKRYRAYDEANRTLTSLELNESEIHHQPLIDSPMFNSYQNSTYRERPRLNINITKRDLPMAQSSPAYTLYLFFSTAGSPTIVHDETSYPNTMRDVFIPATRPSPPAPPAAHSPILENIEKYAFKPEPTEEKVFETKNLLKTEPRIISRKKLFKRFVSRKKNGGGSVETSPPGLTNSYDTTVVDTDFLESSNNSENIDSKSNVVGTIRHFFKRASPRKLDSNNSLSLFRRKEKDEIDTEIYNEADVKIFDKTDLDHTTIMGDVAENDTTSTLQKSEEIIKPVAKKQLNLSKESYPPDHFLSLENEDGSSNEDLRGALMFITRFQPQGKKEIRYSTFDGTLLLDEVQKRVSMMKLEPAPRLNP